ncbi:MAG: hypothetical protein ACK55I_15905, partial [bacterium]
VRSRAWPSLPRLLSAFIHEHARLLAELGIEATPGGVLAAVGLDQGVAWRHLGVNQARSEGEDGDGEQEIPGHRPPEVAAISEKAIQRLEIPVFLSAAFAASLRVVSASRRSPIR